MFINTNSSTNHSLLSCYVVFRDDFRKKLSLIILLVLLILTGVFVIVTNAFLIHGLRATTKDMKSLSLTKKLFMYLSCTDLFTGLVAVPIQIWMLVLGRNATCLQIAIQAFTNSITPGIAMFTILSISVTRYLSVRRPKFYQKYVRQANVTVLLVLQALIIFGLTIWYVLSTQRGPNPLLGYFLVFVTFLCAATIGTAVLFNISLLVYLKKLGRQSMITRDREANATYQAEVAKTLLVISLVLVLCYLPNGIVFSTAGYFVLKGERQPESYNYYLPWSHFLMIFNAGVNSLIYMWRDNKITTYYKKLICGIDDRVMDVNKSPEIHSNGTLKNTVMEKRRSMMKQFYGHQDSGLM